MGVRFETTYTTQIQNALPPSNAETVLYTAGVIALAVDSAVVFLQWMVAITAGTGTTAFQFRIRRGSTTVGTSIGAFTWTQKVTAGNIYTLGGCYIDQPGRSSWAIRSPSSR